MHNRQNRCWRMVAFQIHRPLGTGVRYHTGGRYHPGGRYTESLVSLIVNKLYKPQWLDLLMRCFIRCLDAFHYLMHAFIDRVIQNVNLHSSTPYIETYTYFVIWKLSTFQVTKMILFSHITVNWKLNYSLLKSSNSNITSSCKFTFHSFLSIFLQLKLYFLHLDLNIN